jgi:hypothetical protein
MAFLVKRVGLFLRSMTLQTNKRTAFEPMSIAAYLEILKGILVYSDNINRWPLVNGAEQHHCYGKEA